jgi:hypothetical protein
MNYFTYFPPAPELADQIAFYGIHDRPENIPETYLSPPLGFCGFMFYLYIAAGYETKIGAMTAYIDNLIISALYVILILKPQTDVNLLSTPIAWLKMIGTGMNSVMMFMHFRSPDIYAGAYLLQILCVFVFVLDCLYIYWLAVRRRTGQPIV